MFSRLDRLAARLNDWLVLLALGLAMMDATLWLIRPWIPPSIPPATAVTAAPRPAPAGPETVLPDQD